METVINDYKINYTIRGEGDEVAVILQGWGTELAAYNSVADIIAGKYRVVQLDFPGFGGSDEPREPWSVADFADFFVEFMGKLGITEATLLGHSFGGRVIIRLAARKNLPFRIRRIVLIDSAGILPKRSFRQKMKVRRYKLLKKILNLGLVYRICPHLIDEWRSRQGSEDYRNATPMMRSCLVKAVNEDLTELLPLVEPETLLIWGDQDTATPLADGELMEQKMKNAGLAVIHGAGHFCFLDQPVVFRNIMESYFDI